MKDLYLSVIICQMQPRTDENKEHQLKNLTKFFLEYVFFTPELRASVGQTVFQDSIPEDLEPIFEGVNLKNRTYC